MVDVVPKVGLLEQLLTDDGGCQEVINVGRH